MKLNNISKKVERVYFEIDEDKLDQWEKPQIKESKKAFFYATISDGGDKEKMECFVDFCEDAIFEMQHSASLIETEDGEGAVSFKRFFKIILKMSTHFRLLGVRDPQCRKKMSQGE